MTAHSSLPRAVELQLPWKNEKDDYRPIVDVISVLTEPAFASRVLLTSMHVNLVQEEVYLSARVTLSSSLALRFFTLYRHQIHSMFDDVVNYQCFYGLATVENPDEPVYWLGTGMRLRNGKLKHFPADASLPFDEQWNAMLHQDPGK